MAVAISHYILDTLWQLGSSCCSCFPSSTALKINGRAYKILRLLGEGGFSYVYLVQQPSSPELLALKKIRCPFGEESVTHALKEVEAYALFAPHPNIIRSLDHAVVTDAGGDASAKTVYILLPYYRHGNLQDTINANLVNGSTFPQRRLMVLFRGVCEALKAMHYYRPGNSRSQKRAKSIRREGERADQDAAQQAEAKSGSNPSGDDDTEAEPLIEEQQSVTHATEGAAKGQPRAYAHRDIKPGNIMIDDNGTSPILMDLGSLASSPTTITDRTIALQVQDTAAEHSTMPYRAPELFDVKVDTLVDTKVDIWSLGCTLYACLVGKSPFEARSEETGGSLSLCVLGGDWRFPDEGQAMESQKKRGKQRLVPPGEAQASGHPVINDGIKGIVRQCLKVEPEERPDVIELIRIVDKVIASLPPDDQAD